MFEGRLCCARSGGTSPRVLDDSATENTALTSSPPPDPLSWQTGQNVRGKVPAPAQKTFGSSSEGEVRVYSCQPLKYYTKRTDGQRADCPPTFEPQDAAGGGAKVLPEWANGGNFPGSFIGCCRSLEPRVSHTAGQSSSSAAHTKPRLLLSTAPLLANKFRPINGFKESGHAPHTPPSPRHFLVSTLALFSSSPASSGGCAAPSRTSRRAAPVALRAPRRVGG